MNCSTERRYLLGGGGGGGGGGGAEKKRSFESFMCLGLVFGRWQ